MILSFPPLLPVRHHPVHGPAKGNGRGRSDPQIPPISRMRSRDGKNTEQNLTRNVRTALRKRFTEDNEGNEALGSLRYLPVQHLPSDQLRKKPDADEQRTFGLEDFDRTIIGRIIRRRRPH